MVRPKWFIVQHIENRKGRMTDNIVIATPVILNNIEENGRYLVRASIKVSKTNNMLELYEVFCVNKNEGQTGALTTTSFNNKVSSRGATDYPSVLTLLQEVNNVNRKNNLKSYCRFQNH